MAAREGKRKKPTVTSSVKKDLLQPEQPGFIELDEDETVESITQHNIAGAVDIASASRFFELKLDKFGPYKCNYTKNGRHLLLAGRLGHLATLDWHTKELKCEFSVKETVRDIAWLHQETQFVVAQKQWTYIYDNQGLEIHCLKSLDRVLRLEYLPHHFLLAAAHEKGYLTWLDISIGQKVGGFGTHHGRLDVMCQNRSNAVLHLGHAAGTVTLWSPNVKEFLVKMKCHNSGTRSIAVDHTGRYMATSGLDRRLSVWDLRMYKALQTYTLARAAGQLAFSQRGLLAAGLGCVVEVYRDACIQTITQPYLTHRLAKDVDSLQFCPFEDVLGVGHGDGFSSLLIPGSGEPNFDAYEANPFQTKQQRRETEVKKLLDKIQPSMISLDADAIGQVNVKSLQQKLEEKAKLLWVKPQKVDFTPRYKKKGGSKTGKREQRKQGVVIEQKLRVARQDAVARQKQARGAQLDRARHADNKTDPAENVPARHVLDRFKKKSA